MYWSDASTAPVTNERKKVREGWWVVHGGNPAVVLVEIPPIPHKRGVSIALGQPPTGSHQMWSFAWEGCAINWITLSQIWSGEICKILLSGGIWMQYLFKLAFTTRRLGMHSETEITHHTNTNEVNLEARFKTRDSGIDGPLSKGFPRTPQAFILVLLTHLEMVILTDFQSQKHKKDFGIENGPPKKMLPPITFPQTFFGSNSLLNFLPDYILILRYQRRKILIFVSKSCGRMIFFT